MTAKVTSRQKVALLRFIGYPLHSQRIQDFSKDEVPSWWRKDLAHPYETESALLNAIKEENTRNAEIAAEMLSESLRAVRQLAGLIKQAPRSVDLSQHRDNYSFLSGTLRLGYTRFPGGIEGLLHARLRWSRLIAQWPAKMRKLHPQE